MERYQGVILVRLKNVGTKSEGQYAYLVCDDDMNAIRLCREGQPPFNDPYFVAFDRQETIVSGRMSHEWLIVDAVEVINRETENNPQP